MFRISPEVMDRIEIEVEQYPEFLGYAQAILVSVRTIYPPLYEYYFRTVATFGEDWHAYAIGLATSYPASSSQAELGYAGLSFTEEDIDRVENEANTVFSDGRFAQPSWVLQQLKPSSKKVAPTSLRSFVKVLAGCAPLVKRHMVEAAFEIEDPQNLTPFLRGNYDGFMPFYLKLTDA